MVNQNKDKEIIMSTLGYLTRDSPKDSWFAAYYLIDFVGANLSVVGSTVIVQRCLEQLVDEGRAERTEYHDIITGKLTPAYRAKL